MPPAELKFTQDDIEKLSKLLRDPQWYAEQRLKAWRMYKRTPMPTLQDEAWRRTDIRSMRWQDVEHRALNPKSLRSKDGKVPAKLLKPLVGKDHGGQIIINNGKVTDRSLDSSLRRQGVVFTDLRTAVNKHRDLLEKYLGKAVKIREGKFAAMAAALADQGVFVYVPKKTKVELPLHSVIWADGPAHFSRLVVALDDGASLTFVHEVASRTRKRQSLHVGTVEVYVGRASNVRFIELQSLGQNDWHFTHERAKVKRDGQLDWIFSAIGSKLTKNFSEIDLVGNRAWGRMSGFYFADGVQHLDHDTQQNHLAENTTSDLLFKGALRDSSRSVWQGMIYVAPGAQKTDGYQANRNLVLSNSARADAIPGLEILADEVRCTHAATVGQLESEHIFYLMTRGLSYEEAKKLVVDGFFDPVMQRIPFEGVRNRLKKAISEKMS